MTVNNNDSFIKDLDLLAALQPISSENSKRYFIKDKKGDLGVSKERYLSLRVTVM